MQGEVSISGAKNAALPIIAATLLAPGVHRLYNVPPLADIRTTKRLLGLMGVQFEDGEPLVVDSTRLTGWMAPYETVKTMRAAVLVLGPLVARARQASVSLPGGCAIGARPIDQHLKGLEAMGVKITLNQGYVEAKAKRLHGADITLDLPTVTGTENLMMAATLAKGTTRLVNAAQEPEVTDLARFLTAMGAQIEGIGTDVLTIHGVKALTPASYTIMSDRIEAGTYLAAAAITRGQVTITNAPVPHMSCGAGKIPRGRGAPQHRGRPDHGGAGRLPHRRGRHDPSLSRLSHGHAGPVHGPHVPGQGRQRHHRNHLRKPLHARQRTQAPGRRHHRERQPGGRPGLQTSPGRPGHGHGPAGQRLPGHRRAGRPAPPKSSGSTTWTGATPTWWKNSRPWERGLGGCRSRFWGRGQGRRALAPPQTPSPTP